MSLRSLSAAMIAFVGMASVAMPALAIEPLKLPNANLPSQDGTSSSTAPDGLFDKSIPDSWDNKSTTTHTTSTSGFHFTVTSQDNGFLPPQSSYGNANVPLSEFYHPMPVQQDPLFNH